MGAINDTPELLERIPKYLKPGVKDKTAFTLSRHFDYQTDPTKLWLSCSIAYRLKLFERRPFSPHSRCRENALRKSQ
jgi:hypothetical protein